MVIYIPFLAEKFEHISGFGAMSIVMAFCIIPIIEVEKSSHDIAEIYFYFLISVINPSKKGRNFRNFSYRRYRIY